MSLPLRLFVVRTCSYGIVVVNEGQRKEAWIANELDVSLPIDMKQHFVIDPLIGKRQQLLLATQLCRMVLKVRLILAFSLPLFFLCLIVISLPPTTEHRHTSPLSTKTKTPYTSPFRTTPLPIPHPDYITHIRLTCHLVSSQVNNVIIAGSDENDF